MHRKRIISIVVMLGLLALPQAASAIGPADRVAPPTTQVPLLRRSVPSVDPASLLVTFEESAARSEMARSIARAGVSVVTELPDIRAAEVAVEGGSLRAAEARLEREPAVAAVEPNRVRFASGRPDDFWFSYEQHLFSSRVTTAWNLSKGSDLLDIAVLDTGIDLDHPDFVDRLSPGYDFVDDDPFADDEGGGHGTLVAAIAAAKPDNGRAVAGVAWNSRVMPVRVLNDDRQGTDADIVSGILFATDAGAEVIVLSLAAPGHSDALEAAVRYALDHDVVVVAAAGNDGTDAPSYPAAYDGVLAVGASDVRGDVAWFSNRGPWVDIVADGVDVASAWPWNHSAPAESLPRVTGTSFAAAQVAGVALLARARDPHATQNEIVDAIVRGAADRGPPGIDDYTGHGFLDAYAALGGRVAASPKAPVGDAQEPDGTPARAKPVTAGPRTLSPEGDVDWHYVDTPAAGTLSITLTPPPNEYGYKAQGLDAVLRAYTPNRKLIDSARAAQVGGTVHLKVPIGGPGRYLFEITNSASARTLGAYTVATAFKQESPREFVEETYPTGSTPESVAIADVTGDGLQDVLLVTNGPFDPENDDKLFVFEQKPDGELATPVKYPTHGAREGNLATADLDGDGDQDAALATPNGIDVYAQDGGTLASPDLITGVDGAWMVRAADMTGDGRPDLIAGANEGTLLLERRTDGWTKRVISNTAIRGMEVGDVNGDGRGDVAGVSYGSIRVLRQNTDGTFAPTDHPGAMQSPSDLFEDAEIADINGDGRQDVIAGVSSDHSRLNVFAQKPDGSLAAPEVVASSGDNDVIDAADLDGDGRTDLVALHSSAATVHHQRPDGTLAPEQWWYAGQDEHHTMGSLAIGDVTGDGMPDIAGADYWDGLVLRRQRDRTAGGARTWIAQAEPAAFARDVASTAPIHMTFEREVDPASISATTVRLRDRTADHDVETTRTYEDQERRVALLPSAPLSPSHTYEVSVAGVLDSSGDALNPPYGSRFTVHAPAPTIDLDHDFNDDGYEDAVVGAPGEDVGRIRDAGAVHVLYGSTTGPQGPGSQIWTQGADGLGDLAEAGDRFGSAFAVGDANHDGFDDLAIGVPFEDIDDTVNAGMVHVLFGSPGGLVATGSQLWTQRATDPLQAPEDGDLFGTSLAFGDFDDVTGDELAIGAPGQTVATAARAGAVHVLPGTASGPTAQGARTWTQDSADVEGTAGEGDVFGAALAAGDFDGDTHDELAAGAPGDDGDAFNSGTVTILQGTIVGLRPAILQGHLSGSSYADRYGAVLAIADLGGTAPIDPYADLVIGAPGSGTSSAPIGKIAVYFSDAGSLGLAHQGFWQGSGTGDTDEPGDLFGASVGARRVGSTPGILIVGAPREDTRGRTDVGAVHLFTGGTFITDGDLVPCSPSVRGCLGFYGLGAGRVIDQDTPGVPETAESGDRFGAALHIIDTDGDRAADAIVGTPGESVGTRSGAGSITVMRGLGAVPRRGEEITQDTSGVPGSAEAGDAFGGALG